LEAIILELIKVLGQIGIFAFAATLIQKRIDHSAAERLEEFKASLNLMSSKETVLHNKRFLVIEELNSRLVDLDYAMRTLTFPLKFDPTEESEAQLFDSANNAFQVFNMFFEKNKIYFPIDTCKVLENIRQKFYDALWNYDQPRRIKGMMINDGGELLRQVQLRAIEVYQQVKDEFPVLREGFEKELRQILKVAENDKI